MANNSTNPVIQLNDADAGHYRKIEGYASKVAKLYRKAIRDISALASKVGAIPQTDQFSFGHNPGIEQEVDAVIARLARNISAVIEQGDREQWLAACTKGDAFVDAILRTSALPKPLVSTYKARNLESLAAFQERKINGLNLSERVWQHVSVLKKEVESVVDTSARYAMNGIDAPENIQKIEAAIGSGLSADALSREVRQCLQEPDRLFRRIRDKYGRLHLSKNAELYHPGQGVYRSSYKNAMRMTRTEINMAYRQSDYLRWQQLDFVVGIRISLSGNHTCLGADGKPHPFTDICDILAGDYPKDFKYTGWHPQCRCKAVPILKPYDEWNEDRKYLNKPAYRQLPASNSVGSLPPAYMNYIKANAQRISRWKSQPYYIKDNMHYFWHSLSPQKYPLARLSLDADTMSRLADYRMYAYTHQGSAKFGTALDNALTAQMSGNMDLFEKAMKEMEFVRKTNERVQAYHAQKRAEKAKLKLQDPAELRHRYDAQIDALRTNAAKYKLDMTRIDEAYTSLDMKKIEAAIKEQQAILDARVARMEKIYAAAEKRHAAEDASLGGLTRREKAEKILEERRARFEAISKKSTSLMAEAGEYTMDIDLARLRDLQARKQYNQMGRENSVIEATISEIKAADISMARFIPDVATLHKQYSLDELKQAYNEIDFAIKSSSSLDLKSQEGYLKGVLINTGNPVVKRGLNARLAEVRTDIRIAELTPDVTDIVNASQKSSVNAFHEITARAEAALRSRDVAQAEALLDMAREMQPVVDMYEKLLATGYKTSQKFNKAMADCLDALDNGDLPGALAYVQEAAKIKAQNDANVARRKAREARQAAEQTKTPARKKIINIETENIEDIREALGERTPVLLKHYEQSVKRVQFVDDKYKADEKAFRDKMKAMFDSSNFSHCFRPQYLDGYLDKGILTNLQSSKGDYSGRRSWGHFGYGFQNDQRKVPEDKWLKDGDYYRCGVPVSKDPTEAYKQLSGYGECQLVLRKDKVVTTFTFDNSLGQDTIPSLTCDPKVCSLDSKNMRRFKDKTYSVKTVADGSWNDYIEIQYLPMGDTQFIGPECFQSITIPRHPVGYRGKDKEFWEKWADKGVDVMYYDSKQGKVVTYLKGKEAIPAKYNETAAQKKARRAMAAKRAEERHRKRDALLKKSGISTEDKLQQLIQQRSQDIAQMMSESRTMLANTGSLANADFGTDKFKRLEELVKAGNARGAKTEVERIKAELQAQKKELEKLKDLIPDYEKWHKNFTIEELQNAHEDIRKQIDWMENRYPKRDDPNEVIGKWGRIAKYVENPDSGVRSVTWQIARDAYIRKQDELIYQYRRDSIDENLSRIKAFKTKDKEFAEIRKELQIQSSAGRWGKVEELIESAKNKMIELMPPPVSEKLLKLGECAQVLFKNEDFEQARKEAAKWFRAKKETSAQINKAFKEADAYMSQYAEEMWKNLTKEEKMVLWLYSDGSQYINQEILGTYCLRMKSWIDRSLRNGLADANVLTSIIEKAPALRDDIWMQTGKSVDAFRSMFGTSLSPGMNLNGLVGKEGTNELFMSCHAARNGAFTKNANTGMSNDVVMTIYMPKGTKGVYMEPFASWGDSKRGEEGFRWDGTRRKEAPSDQVEFLLQRGARFRITKAKYENGKWFIDVDLIEQKAAGMLNTTIPDIDYRPIRFKKPAS